MAPADAGRAHPGPGPKSMALDGLVGIGGAAGQVAALAAKDARERQLVEPDHRVRGAARRNGERAHDACADSADAFAAIWPSASATASNVSSVEAWRAL